MKSNKSPKKAITFIRQKRKDDEYMAVAVYDAPFVVGKKKPGAKITVIDSKKEKIMLEALKKYESKK